MDREHCRASLKGGGRLAFQDWEKGSDHIHFEGGGAGQGACLRITEPTDSEKVQAASRKTIYKQFGETQGAHMQQEEQDAAAYKAAVLAGHATAMREVLSRPTRPPNLHLEFFLHEVWLKKT